MRAHEEAKRHKAAAEAAMHAIGLPRQHARFIRLIIGSVFDVQGEGATPGCRLVLLARNREGYGELGELITLARLRCAKGEYRLTVRDLDAPRRRPGHLRGLHGLPDCHALLIPRREDDDRHAAGAGPLAEGHASRERAPIAVELLLWADDAPLRRAAGRGRRPPPACRWPPPATC